MLDKKIRIGTRASELALWQAKYIAAKLEQVGVKTQLVPIETTGDKILNKAISKIGSKGVFTEELEEMLREDRVDIAVHSAKDMQSSLPEDLEIIAFTDREEAYDVVVSYNKYFSFDESQKLIIGTSSTRRVAMLKYFMPKIRTSDIRGNLQTRFRKLEEGHYDALILAYAGVKRMGYEKLIIERLSTDKYTPPVGQGSVAVQASKNLPSEIASIIKNTCNNEQVEICLKTERAFLRTLEGGCSVPVFGYATLENNIVTLNAGIVSLNGKQFIREIRTTSIEDSLAMGVDVANYILEQGGAEILKNLKNSRA